MDNRNNNSSRKPHIVFIALFFLFISVFSLFTFFREKTRYSYFENRLLAPAPELSAQGVLSGKAMSDCETYIKDYVFLRDRILEAGTFIDLRVIGRPVVNDVVVTDGSLLPLLSFRDPDPDDIERRADEVAKNLKSHADEVESYGGHFLYVAVPCQYVCREDEYPPYLSDQSDYTDLSSAALFSRLEAAGVEYVDMLRVFDEKGITKDVSSAVDNHYGIEGGYETYLSIMSALNGDGLDAQTLMREDTYTVELPNFYLGSRTRKLFGISRSNEKLSLIYPSEPVPFTRTDGGEEVDGSVYLIPPEGDDALYSVYMGGDVASTVIETDRADRPDLLIYGDSFTNAVECVAWYGFDTTYSYDFRYYSDKSLSELIAELKPDAVVCIRDYEALLEPNLNGQ